MRSHEGQENFWIARDDIKLFCDFSRKKISSVGRELPFDVLKTEGAVYFDPAFGMAVFKGGVNEISDPGFGGDGWELGAAASYDDSQAFTGGRSLRVEGVGGTAPIAWLGKNISIVGGDCRAISFFYNCPAYQQGRLEVRAMVVGGESRSGTALTAVDSQTDGWERKGFIWRLPPDTLAYFVEIFSAGFIGNCYFDAFLSEAKDFFTPYFDGDEPGCLWVSAAPPQHVYANPVIGGPTARMIKRKKYFYRISSVDSAGRESPASYEVSARTGFRHRKVALTWDRDPEAVKYRVYRGEDSRLQKQFIELEDKAVAWSSSTIRGIKPNIVFELSGNTACFEDAGFGGTAGKPPALGDHTGAVHASRSLRPDPDARLVHNIGLDLSLDFSVAGEIEPGFDSNQPFRPASFFEIGCPLIESMLAVSVRYVPKWGDQHAQILLIKMFEGKEKYAKDNVKEFGLGSVIRFVAAQNYTGGESAAGAHLWYKIDNGEVRHIFLPDCQNIGRDRPVLTISKRFYFDDFANNSFCRMLAFIQRAEEQKAHYILQMASAGKMADLFSFEQ